jgi:multidrug efflux pump subunit AcrB
VLSILIFAGGLIAIPLLPIGEYPEVVPPSVVVRTVYPGANPKVIAETVATPLEEAINGVEGMTYIKSVAGSDGVLQMTGHLPSRHRRGRRGGARAEPRGPVARAAARGRAPTRA